MSGAVTVVGYAYDADIYCVACAQRRYAEILIYNSARSDEHGIPFSAVDREGNTVGVVFSTDESARDDDCADCHAPLLSRGAT